MIVDRHRVATALPGYELGAEVGAGAFGLVLAARHRRLDRSVAVKILTTGRIGAEAGFAAEAKLLAAMDHPHLVRVYDYVEAGDLHMIVMELLGGGTLASRQEGMAPEAACAVGLAVAAGLSCAHAQGVLHRDIKPANVLFDAAGMPKITDFGIAKIVEGTAATASGVVGTPVYMAPEQILGGRLGPATDIYALGVVLYQLLAGVPPFDPTLPLRALWQHHLDTTPAPPAGVPAPVAQVVLRALAKDPAARPPSAHAFALDLARAATTAYGPRWTARSGLVLRLDDEVRDAAGDHLPTPPTPSAMSRARRATPTEPPARSRSTSPVSRTVQDRPAPIDSRSPAPTRDEGSTRIPSEPGRADVATWPARYPGSQVPASQVPASQVPASQVPGSQVPGSQVPAEPGRTSSRRRRRIFAAILLLLLAVTGTVLAVRCNVDQSGNPGQIDTGNVNTAAFSPDGRTLASGSGHGTVVLRDVTDPAAYRVLGQPLEHPSGGSVEAVAFSPDSRTLASGGYGGTVWLWDVTDPANPRSFGQPLNGHTEDLEALAFSPDGKTLASASDDDTVRLWDVTNPANPGELATLNGHTGDVNAVAFSPDRRTLASAGGSGDGTVRLWDVTEPADPSPLGEPLTGHTGFVSSVAFSPPDGTTLASGSGDGTVRLWDVTKPADPSPLGKPLTDDSGRVWSVAFSPPDGTTLASASDGTVQLWDVTNRAASRSLGQPLATDLVQSVAFSPDGRTLARGYGTVVLWDVTDPANPRSLGG